MSEAHRSRIWRGLSGLLQIKNRRNLIFFADIRSLRSSIFYFTIRDEKLLRIPGDDALLTGREKKTIALTAGFSGSI